MSDYINRKTALTIFKQWDDTNPNWTSSRVKDLLMYINAEDVIKARRGKWTNGDPICPICGEDKFKGLDADIWADWKPKYCPNCGANMEETNGEKETL